MAEKAEKFKDRTARWRAPPSAVSLDKGLKSTYPRPVIRSDLFTARCPCAPCRLGLTRMGNIFFSYAREDQQKAVKLAAVFERQHWVVIWDSYTIRPGVLYARFDWKSSEVVVALFSRAPRESFFERDAPKYLGQIPLVFVMLEKVQVPLDFQLVPAFDLSGWDGTASHAGLQSLLRHLRALIGSSSPPAEPRAAPTKAPRAELRPSSTKTTRTDAGKPSRSQKRPRKRPADSRPESDKRFKGVFISYRRDEAAAYAGRLYDRLVARFGKERVFFDHENVGWGEDFVDVITEAAESCAVMIALVSRQWARGAGGQAGADDYVRLEVAKALGRKILVIPILIQGASLPAPKELPEDLSPLLRRNALALSDARWERDVEDLIKTLEGLLKT